MDAMDMILFFIFVIIGSGSVMMIMWAVEEIIKSAKRIKVNYRYETWEE